MPARAIDADGFRRERRKAVVQRMRPKSQAKFAQSQLPQRDMDCVICKRSIAHSQPEPTPRACVGDSGPDTGEIALKVQGQGPRHGGRIFAPVFRFLRLQGHQPFAVSPRKMAAEFEACKIAEPNRNVGQEVQDEPVAIARDRFPGDGVGRSGQGALTSGGDNGGVEKPRTTA